MDFIYVLPNFDPVAINFGFIQLRWYSMAYMLAIILGIYHLYIFNKKFNLSLTKPMFDDLPIYVFLMGIIFGRLGHVVFYDWAYYSKNLIEIVQIWKGGMSIHGGIVGGMIGILLFSKKYKYDSIKLMDYVTPAVAIGIFFGRFGNMVNGELNGAKTDGTWGVIYSNLDKSPRHPSQIYEMLIEGLFVYALAMIIIYKFNGLAKRGAILGNCLIVYGVGRIIVEFFKMPSNAIGTIDNNLTMGQILSVPMIMFGVYLVKRIKTA